MSSETKVSIEYKPREQFKAFHARSQRWSLLVYHRRAGKTTATINDLIDKALKCRKPDPKFAYIAPLLSQAESVAWQALKKYVKDIPGHKVEESKKRVWIPTTHPSAKQSMAEIRLFGADNPDNLRGQYFDGVVLDEVAQMKKSTWGEVVRPALTERKGWAVFIGTPKGKNFFYDLYEIAKNSPDKWFCQVLKASESGILPPEELEDARDASDDETYDQEFECSFTAGIKGAYWATQLSQVEADGKFEDFPVVKAAPVHVALDLGYTDATAAWFYQVINGEVRFIDYDEWNEIKIDDVVDDIIRKGYKMGEFWLPHDAKNKSWQTGKSGIELLLARGIKPRQVPELSVADGIAAVRHTLPKVRFHGTNCYQGLEALKNYSKKPLEGGGFSKSPIHNWASHGADAFRYACLSISESSLADSCTKMQPIVSSEQARESWEQTTRINTVENKGPTLDELFARQRRSTYIRI